MFLNLFDDLFFVNDYCYVVDGGFVGEWEDVDCFNWFFVIVFK